MTCCEHALSQVCEQTHARGAETVSACHHNNLMSPWLPRHDVSRVMTPPSSQMFPVFQTFSHFNCFVCLNTRNSSENMTVTYDNYKQCASTPSNNNTDKMVWLVVIAHLFQINWFCNVKMDLNIFIQTWHLQWHVWSYIRQKTPQLLCRCPVTVSVGQS